MSIGFFHRPDSVAVVGASDDPEKIGGRPLRYMREFGFRGRILPVNPRRAEVQGLRTVPSLDALADDVPDVALIAVPGRAAVDAVATAARLGVRGAVVMSSGFGEVSSPEGTAMQADMLEAAGATGMRIIGPNTQGIADFSSGAILGFSTLFTEQPPEDGPVAIVSQSGAMCSVPYGILRRRGIGIRYAHATGNDADVTAGELGAATLDDPDVRLLLLYLESVRDPASLVALAERARERDVPVVALVGGRSAGGGRAAASHTGALATERHLLDAFFARIGIQQVDSMSALVDSTDLYLRYWRDRPDGLAVVSNSGASCVLAADAAEDAALPLAELSEVTKADLKEQLPAFATVSNPVDVTAALLTDSSIFGRVLPVLGDDPAVGTCLLSIPVAGRGYDVEQFAADAARYAADGGAIVLAVPQPSVAAPFRDAGLVVFDDETAAIRAIAQLATHRRRAETAAGLLPPALGDGRRVTPGTMRNESDSLALLAELGIPIVDHHLVTTADDAAAAFARLGTERAVVKGCTAAVGHKSELGLVELGCGSPEEVRAAAERIVRAAADHDVTLDGLLVAPMVRGLREVLVGAHRDPVFGPVMVVGAGGSHVEAMPDSRVLLAPCTPQEVRSAISELRMAPILAAVRGEPAADVDAWVTAVVRASQALADPDSTIQGFDANPLLLAPDGEGAVAVDAVVYQR